MKPKLQLPFKGDYPITFSFGAQATDEELQKKFHERGIIGHHGIDFGTPEGTNILATGNGKVIQAGTNGDFGISVTIEHSWCQSIYAHLQEARVAVGDRVKTGALIGLSGKIGFVSGAHLHFGIKLNNADPKNGYLGFTDPLIYLPHE